MLPAMVLAAGFGTRLRPLTDELPKPLVPIGETCVLERVVGDLFAAEVRRVVVNAHHLPEAIEAAVQGFARPGLELAAVREPVILGTAGGVHHAARALGDGDVLVCNGDILCELDVPALLELHQRHRPFATLAVAPPLPGGESTVGIGADGRVVRLRALRLPGEERAASFVGWQILSPAARAALACPGCLVGDVYLPALARGERLLAAPVAARFTDVGTVASYLAANLDWLAARKLEAWCGAGAAIAPEVRLEQAVVGRGAVVAGAGRARRAVIWPGAQATAPLERCVVTGGGRIVLP